MFAEDLSVFFNPAEFGTSGVLDGVAVTGILDTGYAQALGELGTLDPRYRLTSAAAATTAPGSTLVAGGVNWLVRGAPQHDGTGICTLMLERA